MTKGNVLAAPVSSFPFPSRSQSRVFSQPVKPCPYPNAAELSLAGQLLRQCSGQAWAAVPTQSGGTGETPVLHRIVGTQVWRAKSVMRAFADRMKAFK